LPFFTFELALVALALKPKSLLIIPGNLLHKRGLVSYRQGHGFRKMVVLGRDVFSGQAP
jgi:hypothetical protein